MKRHTIPFLFVSSLLICSGAGQVVAQKTQKTSMIAQRTGKTIPYSRSVNNSDGAIQGFFPGPVIYFFNKRSKGIILDELGYLGLGPGGPLLFQSIAQMYERS